MVSVDVKLFAYLLTYLLTYWPVQQAGCIPYARVLVQVWSREAGHGQASGDRGVSGGLAALSQHHSLLPHVMGL